MWTHFYKDWYAYIMSMPENISNLSHWWNAEWSQISIKSRTSKSLNN